MSQNLETASAGKANGTRHLEKDFAMSKHCRVIFVSWILAFCIRDASAADWTSEARDYLGLCASRDDCKKDQAMFVGEYQLAFRGDYTAQRNTALCLSGGCGASYSVRPHPAQACAWRLVLAQSGHPQYDAGDSSNLRSACDKLTVADRQAATARAERILREIEPLPRRELTALRDELYDSIYGKREPVVIKPYVFDATCPTDQVATKGGIKVCLATLDEGRPCPIKRVYVWKDQASCLPW